MKTNGMLDRAAKFLVQDIKGISYDEAMILVKDAELCWREGCDRRDTNFYYDYDKVTESPKFYIEDDSLEMPDEIADIIMKYKPSMAKVNLY